MVKIHDFLMQVIEFGAMVLATLILVGLVAVVVLYILDVTQTQQAIRRNYPVIGRFRYLFEHLGVFFRQYFFAMDREELPFNRAQRGWIARAAKDIDHTIAFGSTKPIHTPGDILFLNSAFPKLEEETELAERTPLRFGEGYARAPYETHSVFHISAMSYGALSAPAIQALSSGAAEAGILLNTGEGGLAPYHLEGECDLVFQIGTAKYGVRDSAGNLCDTKLKEVAAHSQVKMFEIKLSQGAKPGKGGILPAAKVTDVIARTRGIPEGEDSLSPNRHTDIASVDDLLTMIHRIRAVTGKPVGIKFVLGQPEWLDELCSSIHERGLDHAPDFVTVDSADGGTGAAPQSLMDNVGLPADSSLPWVVDKLEEHQLRPRIKVMSSGKMSTPSGVAAALCLGADSVNTARGFMFALGCIQALQCNKNTCPTGITTHDPDLQKGLDPRVKAKRVANYARNLIKEVEIVAHSCGVVNAYELSREHAYLVTANGLPERLSKRYPGTKASTDQQED
ncbi:MAG: FMN-binding glutamate synthase family protein [Luminiphilus sp.]|nr:FMN-binding glutamate synthase family protein [Luminiphilus sp.]